MSIAWERVSAILGGGSPSPEVAAPILRRDAELFTGMTAGHRLNRHGIVYGLDYAFKALGEAAKVPTIKDYSELIARTISGVSSLLGLLFLRGKWSRMIAFGILFENVEAGIDYGIEAVRKAVGASSPSE